MLRFVYVCPMMWSSEWSLPCAVRREVQRILMELLNQMDGFDQTTNVKVCPSIFFCCSSHCSLIVDHVQHSTWVTPQ